MQRLRFTTSAGVGLVTAATMALGLSACGSSDKDKGGTSKAASGTAAKASAIPSSAVDWAVRYTGGKAAKADASLAPVVIGYVNEEGGTPSFPAPSDGVKTALQFINNNLGGIDGHPIQLKTCIVHTEEDGQRCGAEMVNDKAVKVVLGGENTVGNEAFYKTLGRKVPVLSAQPAVAADFGTPGVYTYTTGFGLVLMQASIAKQLVPGAKTVAAVVTDNASGNFVAQQALKPQFDALGIKLKVVGISVTATAPEVASALQAAGADTADVIVTVVIQPQCISLVRALQSQHVTTPVVATFNCYDPAVLDANNGKPGNDWTFVGNTDNPFVPDAESGTDAYTAAAKVYGGKYAYTGDATPVFTGLMTLAKFGNELGSDGLTPKAWEDKIATFAGPEMMQPGALDCGYSKASSSVCAKQTNPARFKDGKWTRLPTQTVPGA